MTHSLGTIDDSICELYIAGLRSALEYDSFRSGRDGNDGGDRRGDVRGDLQADEATYPHALRPWRRRHPRRTSYARYFLNSFNYLTFLLLLLSRDIFYTIHLFYLSRPSVAMNKQSSISHMWGNAIGYSRRYKYFGQRTWRKIRYY